MCFSIFAFGLFDDYLNSLLLLLQLLHHHCRFTPNTGRQSYTVYPGLASRQNWSEKLFRFTLRRTRAKTRSEKLPLSYVTSVYIYLRRPSLFRLRYVYLRRPSFSPTLVYLLSPNILSPSPNILSPTLVYLPKVYTCLRREYKPIFFRCGPRRKQRSFFVWYRGLPFYAT